MLQFTNDASECIGSEAQLQFVGSFTEAYRRMSITRNEANKRLSTT